MRKASLLNEFNTNNSTNSRTDIVQSLKSNIEVHVMKTNVDARMKEQGRER